MLTLTIWRLQYTKSEQSNNEEWLIISFFHYYKHRVQVGIYELLFEIDNATPSYTYHHITKYVSKTILCMINIQGLDYGRFDRLVSNYYECDGEELTIRLRESLNKRKVVL